MNAALTVSYLLSVGMLNTENGFSEDVVANEY